MTERAALIGGRLAVWSEVAAGTEVELRLPASDQCTRPPGGRSWVVTAVRLPDTGLP